MVMKTPEPEEQSYLLNSYNANKHTKLKAINENISRNNTITTALQNSYYLKTFIMGSTDGVLYILILIVALESCHISIDLIIALGVSISIAASMNIAICEYTASQAQGEFINNERRKQLWEFRSYKEMQIQNMISQFCDKGMSKNDSDFIVRKISNNETLFVDLLISDSIGLQIQTDNEDNYSNLKDSFVIFLSFFVSSIIPLLPYVIFNCFLDEEDIRFAISDDMVFYSSVSLSCLVLFLLGGCKSVFSSGQWIYFACESLGTGVLCSCISFGVGNLVNDLIVR